MTGVEQTRYSLRSAQLRGRLCNWAVLAVTTVLVDVFLLLECTLDVRIYGLEKLRELHESGRNPLLVIWHGQGLMPIAAFRGERMCLYASHTREETYPRHLLALRWWTLRLVERLGYSVLDAAQFKSESRGVMQFVDTLRRGTGSVIAADGPQGPIFKAKPGPAFLAKKTGVSLLPIGSALSGGVHMDQWDQFEVPWPFAEAILCVGEPIEVPSRATDEELESIRLRLDVEMDRLVVDARRRLRTERSQPAKHAQR